MITVSEWLPYESGTLTKEICEDGKMVGWMMIQPGGQRYWYFEHEYLNPEESINNEKLREKCPEMINEMLVYLVHES